MHATFLLLKSTDFPPIKRGKLETLQINIGYRCNQQCVHCHVNAGPKRKEAMTEETIGHILYFLSASKIKTLDITGGAPELNIYFRELVTRARKLNVHVMDRCNLTILQEPGQQDLAEFLANMEVEIIASLPCYEEENVDRQRGKGVFARSIQAIQQLNTLGYGLHDDGLQLNLVYNPTGPYLPPAQDQLEKDFKRELYNRYEIHFNHLYTLTNMPIQRFGSMLISKGLFTEYMQTLKQSYKQDNLNTVMCRTLISVDWQGYVYDCDFNQMLKLPIQFNKKPRTHITDLINIDLTDNPIMIADHCYGCTAGQGSSCGGALT